MSILSKKFGLMSRKVMFGTTLGAALFFMIVGVIFWGGFNTSMEVTNTLKFCISCHEMEENVYQEYKKPLTILIVAVYVRPVPIAMSLVHGYTRLYAKFRRPMKFSIWCWVRSIPPKNLMPSA